jgi:hypothetical protein
MLHEFFYDKEWLGTMVSISCHTLIVLTGLVNYEAMEKFVLYNYNEDDQTQMLMLHYAQAMHNMFWMSCFK